jgi:hypothetical protein
MPAAEDKSPDPLPLPRSLRDHRAIRRELAALYRQAKSGRIDPPLLGRLVHLLSVLGGIIRDIDLEARLARLEEQTAEPDLPRPAVNGRGHHAAH